MEFGPPALGARSILGDPRDATTRDRMNALVKNREGYRPFAPAVLAAHAQRFFDIPPALATTPFMTATVPVLEDRQSDIPAVTHIDGTARVQTVDPRHAPRFAALLEAFGGRTGVPVPLNTSFNVQGEPIVCRAQDALTTLMTSGLRWLAIGDFLVQKRDRPEARFAALAPRLRPDTPLIVASSVTASRLGGLCRGKRRQLLDH